MYSYNGGAMQVDGGGGDVVPTKKAATVMSPGPSDLAKLSPQFSNTKAATPKTDSPSILDRVVALPTQFASNIIGGITRGLGVSTAARATGVTPPAAPKLSTKEAAKITKTVAGELTGIAPAKRVLNNQSTPVLGSKALGTGLDILSAIPVVGSIGKGAAVTGALGKTAKEVGAIQAAGEAAKVAKQATAGKVGAAGAAAMIATSPAGHAADIVKPVTSISQSVEAGKLAKTVVKDVKTSAAPKTSVKTTAQDVTFTPKTAAAKTAAEKASQSSKITKSAFEVSAASKAGQFKMGTADHTKSDVKNTVNSVTNINKKAEDIKQVNANTKAETGKTTESNKKTEDLTKVKDKKTESTKTLDNFKQGDIWNADDPYLKPYKNPYEDKVNQDGEVKDGGSKKPTEESPVKPPRQFIPVVPKVKSSDVEELNRKRKWNPSAIV